MKYRIVNRKRFIAFLTGLILLAAFVFIPAISKATALDRRLDPISITVSRGDTLWTLAKEYGPENQDIRKTIFEIKSCNNMSTSNIYEGQSLIIPSWP